MSNQNTLQLGQWNVICSKCKIEKPSTEYYLRSNKTPSTFCKVCHYQSNKTWAAKNKDKINVLAKKYRETNREVMLERSRKWRKENLAYDAMRQRERNAIKKQAFPKWADRAKIKEIYKNCPSGFHVDHVIPLRGKLVSGLHVEHNLQYLPAVDNYKKRNIYHVS